MQQMIIDVLLEQVVSLKQELAFIEERSNQIKNTLSELETRLSEIVVPADSYPSVVSEDEVTKEDTLPEIEVELIVDEFSEDEESENNENSDNSENSDESDNLEDSENSDNPIIEEPVELPVHNNTQNLLPPIDDIRKGISLGDRFLFQRELFAGDGEKMNKTIDNLNKLSSLDEAMIYLNKHFNNWDKESQAYELFINLLKRRF